MEFEELKLVKLLKDKQSPFFEHVNSIYIGVKDLLNTRIPEVFPDYTLHDTGHSFRIINYMFDIISDPQNLNDLEISILINSALLHDIGMAISDEDLDSIKSDQFDFCDIKYSRMLELMNGNEKLATQEYVRRIHSSLSRKHINTKLTGKFVIPRSTDLDYQKELGLICESHTQSKDWVLDNLSEQEIRGAFSFNPIFTACTLRLADILDIDSSRTPYNLYKHLNLNSYSNEEWKQHFIITNFEKIQTLESGQKSIAIHGKSSNPKIHRKLLGYFDWIQNELDLCSELTQKMSRAHSIVLNEKISVNIQPEGYTFSDFKMSLDFNTISHLLMGEKIYGSKKLGLRELVQNSLDSIAIRQEAESKLLEFGADEYKPKIKIIIDNENNNVIIKDNGMGMSLEIIKNHFLKIGVSYYSSFDFRLQDFRYKPIGNFGIGFLACFMLSKNVIVKTRDTKSRYKYTIDLEKNSQFTSVTRTEDLSFHGTEIILNKSEFFEEFNNVDEIVKFCREYFINNSTSFEVIDKQNEIIHLIENSITNYSKEKHSGVSVDISKYLNDCEGVVKISQKNEFVSNLSDISFKGKIYILTEKGEFLKVPDISKLRINDYLIDEHIKFLDVALIPDFCEDEFQQGIEFTEDIDAVIRKLDDYVEWVTVLLNRELHEVSIETTCTELDDIVEEKLSFLDFVELGHCKNLDLRVSEKKIWLFEGLKNQHYLKVSERTSSFGIFDSIFNFGSKNHVFLRNVLIKDFNLLVSPLASIINFEYLNLNIFNTNIVADISRNKMDDKTTMDINYSLVKAIHLAALEIFNLSSRERETLQMFIKKYLNEDNHLTKDDR